MTSVSLDTDLLEWGKNQSGGLSALLRHLLRQAKEQAEQGTGKSRSSITPLNAPFQINALSGQRTPCFSSPRFFYSVQVSGHTEKRN